MNFQSEQDRLLANTLKTKMKKKIITMKKIRHMENSNTFRERKKK